MDVHFNHSQINWLKLINAQLPEYLHQSEDKEIIVRYKEILSDYLNVLSRVDKR